jgi:glutaminyl-tRNA synthetase
MPTISAYRRRGYTASSIRNFSEKVGVAKRDGVIDLALLEHSIREELNKTADRVMAVLRPLKIVITNYPEDKTELLKAVNNPEDESSGSREIPFSRELYIESHDFQENPHRKFFRLSPGREVRLRYAYIIKCEDVIKDENGNIIELHCTYDPETKSGSAQSQRKVKGTIHWVDAEKAINAEVRLYDRLFNVPAPGSDKEKDFKEFINPDSLEVLDNCKLEPGLKESKPGKRFQFERLGYFCVDSKYTSEDNLVFNRIVTLRDSWAKIEKQNKN